MYKDNIKRHAFGLTVLYSQMQLCNLWGLQSFKFKRYNSFLEPVCEQEGSCQNRKWAPSNPATRGGGNVSSLCPQRRGDIPRASTVGKFPVWHITDFCISLKMNYDLFVFFHFQWINVSFANFWIRLNCFKKPPVLKCGQNWVCLMGLRDNGSREECVCMWETRLPSPRMHFLLQGRTFKNSTDLFRFFSLSQNMFCDFSSSMCGCAARFRHRCQLLVFIQSKCLIMKLPSPNYNLKPQYWNVVIH